MHSHAYPTQLYWHLCSVNSSIAKHTVMVACICHLIFSATTHYFFFKKYCVVASLSQHITFWATAHYFFQKYCVVRHACNTILRYCVVRHVRNTIFLEKIMCCGKFVTTHYFLSHMQHIIFFKKYCVVHHAHNTIFFEKNNVLWQVCRNTLFFLWHNTFFFEKIMCFDKLATKHYFFKKKYCVAGMVHNAVFFKKIIVMAEKIRWQIHATIHMQ